MENSTLKVTVVSCAYSSFAEAMNISKDRETELDELSDKYHKVSGTYPEALASISEELNNANELAYVSFYLGAFAESQRSKQESLKEILAQL
jgi:hypothetical protein